MFVPVPRKNVVHTGKRIALVIGNGDYKSSLLKNPVNDAYDISFRLGRLGFDVSKGTNMTRGEMRWAIREFGDKLKQGGVGLFLLLRTRSADKGKELSASGRH